MKKRKPEENGEPISVKGLVVAGIIFAIAGVTFIRHPVPYISFGAVGSHGSTPVTSVFNSHDTVFIGFIFLLISLFILTVAYKVKKS